MCIVRQPEKSEMSSFVLRNSYVCMGYLSYLREERLHDNSDCGVIYAGSNYVVHY